MNTRGQMIAGMREKQTGLAKCSLPTTLGKTTYQVWTESSQTPTGLCWETHYVKGGRHSFYKNPRSSLLGNSGTNTLPQAPPDFTGKRKDQKLRHTPGFQKPK